MILNVIVWIFVYLFIGYVISIVGVVVSKYLTLIGKNNEFIEDTYDENMEGDFVGLFIFWTIVLWPLSLFIAILSVTAFPVIFWFLSLRKIVAKKMDDNFRSNKK